MKEFFIKSLSLMTPNNSIGSKISFTRGLNVITGPSNTGKSFAFDCIDYVFGKKDLKTIPEANRYDSVVIEIQTINETIYTLKRNFNSNDILIKKGEASIWKDEEAISYSSKHDPTSNNISKFLLEQSGFNSDVKIYKNQSKEYSSLSFRTMSDWLLINESEIISDKDMLQGVSFRNTTLQQGILLYLIEGKCAELNESLKTNKEVIAKIEGNIEVYESNIKSLEQRQTYLKEIIDLKIDFDLSEYESNIAEFNTISLEISTLKESTNVLNNKLFDIKEKINKNMLKLDNFEILRKQYLSDIDRLGSIIENSDLIKSLESKPCPLCNNDIVIDKSGIYLEACTIELENIQQHINALDSLTSDIKSLIDDYNTEKDKKEEESKLISAKIESYSSDLIKNKINIDEYIQYKQSLDEYESIEIKLIDLYTILDNKNNAKSNKPLYKPLEHFNTSVIKSIEKYMTSSFKNINPSLNEVVFSDNLLDIMIDGKSRKNNGKGVRALYKSLFFFYFWKFLKKKSKKCFNFIILDSPLTSYKNKNSDSSNIEDEVDDNIQDKFFEVLSKENDHQIIIFENKEVPQEYKENVNIVEFTKTSGHGRYGFVN